MQMVKRQLQLWLSTQMVVGAGDSYMVRSIVFAIGLGNNGTRGWAVSWHCWLLRCGWIAEGWIAEGHDQLIPASPKTLSSLTDPRPLQNMEMSVWLASVVGQRTSCMNGCLQNKILITLLSFENKTFNTDVESADQKTYQ